MIQGSILDNEDLINTLNTAKVKRRKPISRALEVSFHDITISNMSDGVCLDYGHLYVGNDMESS